MIGTTPNTEKKDLDSYWSRFYNLYKDDIDSLMTKIHNQEDLYGKSTHIYKLLQYELSFNLITALWLEYKEGYETDWDYYNEKYELDTLYDSLICNDINLEDILEIFELPYTDIKEYEINGVAIETNFVLEQLIEDEVEDEGYILYDEDEYIEDEQDIPFIYREGQSLDEIDLFNLPITDINLISTTCQ